MAIKYNNGQWVKNCGCGGGKAGDVVTPPANTSAIVYNTAFPISNISGPVNSNVKYSFMPHTISIDIEMADAQKWVADGVARFPTATDYTNLEGRLTR